MAKALVAVVALVAVAPSLASTWAGEMAASLPAAHDSLLFASAPTQRLPLAKMAPAEIVTISEVSTAQMEPVSIMNTVQKVLCVCGFDGFCKTAPGRGDSRGGWIEDFSRLLPLYADKEAKDRLEVQWGGPGSTIRGLGGRVVEYAKYAKGLLVDNLQIEAKDFLRLLPLYADKEAKDRLEVQWGGPVSTIRGLGDRVVEYAKYAKGLLVDKLQIEDFLRLLLPHAEAKDRSEVQWGGPGSTIRGRGGQVVDYAKYAKGLFADKSRIEAKADGLQTAQLRGTSAYAKPDGGDWGALRSAFIGTLGKFIPLA